MANIMLLLVLSAIGVLVAPNTLSEVDEDGETKPDDSYEQARAERASMEERKNDIVLDRMSCVIVCEILDRYIEETKEDLPYMEETDRKREGVLFDLVFSIRENLIKAYKERWDGKD